MSASRIAGMVAGAVALGLSSAAMAQVPDAPVTAAGFDHPERPDARPTDWRWTLGLGPAMVPEYEGSDRYEVVPLTLVRAQQGPLHATLFGLHLTTNLIPDANWRFGPSLNVRRGYEDADEKAVRRLDVDRAFEIGVKGGYDFHLDRGRPPRSTLALATEFLVDVSDESNGYTITPSLTYRTALTSEWTVAVGGNFSYASDGYMSHYFGVSRGEAAKTGLRARDADADVKNAALYGSVGYAITEAWRATLFAQYKRMLGDAEDSPVVDDKGAADNAAIGLVFSYTW